MPSLVPSSSHELNGAGGIGLVFEMIKETVTIAEQLVAFTTFA